MRRAGAPAAIFLCLTASVSFAAECRWGQAKIIGSLDVSQINEASGLAVSDSPDRLYHVNDSGTDGAFFQTDSTGKSAKKILVEGFQPVDAEAMAYGDCGGGKRCLFIADIGLYKGSRNGVVRRIAVIEEQDKFPPSVRPRALIPIRFPGGLEVDAESLALHPDGDLFLVTKNYDFAKKEALLSGIYRLAHRRWAAYQASDGELELEKIEDFDLRKLPGNGGSYPAWLYQVATSMDIHPSGKKFLILNYITAIEFFHDPSAGPLPPLETLRQDVDYRIIPLQVQAVQESISYTRNGEGLLYTSEVASSPSQGKVPQAKIIRADCVVP